MNSTENINKDIFILVVEDSRTQAAEIEYFLENLNYSIHVCSDGEEAFEWLKSVEIKPDIIVSDIMMPKMGGYELCKAIRLDDDLKDIPVLLLTSLSKPSDIMKSIEAGANKFLTKPYNKELLPQVINELYLNTKNREQISNENGISLTFDGNDYLITADMTQILDLMISSYQSAYHQNIQLQEISTELEILNTKLEIKVQNRTKELFTQKELFKTLTENSPDIIIRYNKNMDVVYANRDIDDIKEVLCTMPEKITSDKEPCNCVEIKDIFEKGIKKQFEFSLLKEGQSTWFNSSFVPEFNENGEVEYMLNVLRDITEQKKVLQELKNKEELMISQSRQAAMGNMISMIAHQWRQPLTVMSMINNNTLLDIEIEDQLDSEQVKNSILKSNEQIEYLNKTIEDFRNFFKPNRSKTSSSVPAVIDKSLELLEKSLINNNIKLTKEYETDNELMMFPNELMQVFINLINNSKDALIENRIDDGHIIIHSYEEDENIITKITDNAGGIPDEISKKIGELNFTTKGDKGTGLGIYMSKMIIEKHLKGYLTWFSEKGNDGVKNGTTFMVSIPKMI